MEPRHLAAGSPSESLSHTTAGWPLTLDFPVPLGAPISLLLQQIGFGHDVRGGGHRRKSHQGLSDKKTAGITSQGGAGAGGYRLYGLLSSPNPPQASADGHCLTAAGRTAGWAGQQVGQAAASP